jgi:hypothetical protein
VLLGAVSNILYSAGDLRFSRQRNFKPRCIVKLKIEAACSSKAMGSYHITARIHTPED